jgi:hypothetical protein
VLAKVTITLELRLANRNFLSFGNKPAVQILHRSEAIIRDLDAKIR